MSIAYDRLRISIEILSFEAKLQVKWLDEFFFDLVDGASAEAYGNDELIEHFYDIYVAQNYMINIGVLSRDEAEASDKLNKLIDELDPSSDEAFWLRQALFNDERWERIRVSAREVLKRMPDRLDEKDWSARYWSARSSKAIPGA